MDRVIKFRGLRTDGKGWVIGYFLQDYSGVSYITTLDGVDTYEVIPETVGQLSNSLSRKAKKEVFVGDRITYDLEAGLGLPRRNNLSDVVNTLEFDYAYYSNVRIIGNIHEESEEQNG